MLQIVLSKSLQNLRERKTSEINNSIGSSTAMAQVRMFSFAVLLATTTTFCCCTTSFGHAEEQPCHPIVYPPTAMTDRVEVRVNESVKLKCTIHLSSRNENLSLYYKFNGKLKTPILAEEGAGNGVFSSRIQDVHTKDLNAADEHIKSLELTIHGLDIERYRNFTIAFVIYRDENNSETEPIRVTVVDEPPSTEPTSAETTTDSPTTEGNCADLVKIAKQEGEEIQKRKSDQLLYGLAAAIVVALIMSVTVCVLTLCIIKLKSRTKQSPSNS